MNPTEEEHMFVSVAEPNKNKWNTVKIHMKKDRAEALESVKTTKLRKQTCGNGTAFLPFPWQEKHTSLENRAEAGPTEAVARMYMYIYIYTYITL